MNGSLARRSPSDVLSEVLRRQASGILRMHDAAATRQLFLDAGVMIRFAVSTLPRESITGLFRDKGTILQLALGLVVFTVVGLGLFIHWMIPLMPLGAAFALAAILSPTDPIAVSAISPRCRSPSG